MTAQGVGARKPAAAAPLAAGLELALADKLLLARVQALVSLAVVLSGKGLAADGADKGALVGVGSQVGAQVVGARESLGAQGALKGGGVLLHALGAALGALVLGIGQAQRNDIVRDGRRRLASAGGRGGVLSVERRERSRGVLARSQVGAEGGIDAAGSGLDVCAGLEGIRDGSGSRLGSA